MKVIISSRGRSHALCVVLVATVLLVVSCGTQEAPRDVPSPTPEPRVASDVERIVVLGDSISAGFGLAEADAFPALLQQQLREAGYSADVLNAGVSGDTSAGGLARLDWVLGGQPAVLVVELGGNDALRGQPLENTESNLRSIVRRGREVGAQVLLLGMDVPTNYGPDYSQRFAELYERIARDEGVALVPAFMREVGIDPKLMQIDGLHPTAEGHSRLAERLYPYLEQMLVKFPPREATDRPD